MTGEKIRCLDLGLMFITFVGVLCVVIGIDHNEHNDSAKELPIWAGLGAFSVPFLLSYGNIIMSKMKGLHENTVSLYINPTLALLMYFLMQSEGLDCSIFNNFSLKDWALMTFFSIATVVLQTLKFIALQNADPGELSHYQYTTSIY
jgi:drug/metabolite transporter (DMT)-like permease